MTSKEFALLELLARRRGEVLPRALIDFQVNFCVRPEEWAVFRSSEERQPYFQATRHDMEKVRDIRHPAPTVWQKEEPLLADR